MEIGITINNELVRNFDFSKKDKNDIRALNDWIGNIKKKDTRLYKILVFTIAGVSYCVDAHASDINGALSAIDTIGIAVLSVLQRVGYWGCLLGCIFEILKSLSSRGTKDIWKIFLKYICIFAVLYMLPVAFNLIIDVFNGI